VGRTWRIGEVADRTGLTRRTLRHYDELGLLVPAGRSGGDYRLYDEDDLLRLLQIQNLKALGLSLPEIVRIRGRAAAVGDEHSRPGRRADR
jgi:DNA-binding transcriptional MerR regulator